jgi:hypothetical protein
MLVHHEFPDPDAPLAPEWTAPLTTVQRLIRGDPRYRFFDVDDFEVEARLARPSLPSLVRYRHRYTHGALHVDADGQAYRHIPPKVGRVGAGRHVRQPLDDAVRALDLWVLPWLKPGLELERRGLSADQSWVLRRALEAGELDDYGGLGWFDEYPRRRSGAPDHDGFEEWDPGDDEGTSGGDEARGGEGRGHLHVV